MNYLYLLLAFFAIENTCSEVSDTWYTKLASTLSGYNSTPSSFMHEGHPSSSPSSAYEMGRAGVIDAKTRAGPHTNATESLDDIMTILALRAGDANKARQYEQLGFQHKMPESIVNSEQNVMNSILKEQAQMNARMAASPMHPRPVNTPTIPTPHMTVPHMPTSAHFATPQTTPPQMSAPSVASPLYGPISMAAGQMPLMNGPIMSMLTDYVQPNIVADTLAQATQNLPYNDIIRQSAFSVSPSTQSQMPYAHSATPNAFGLPGQGILNTLTSGGPLQHVLQGAPGTGFITDFAKQINDTTSQFAPRGIGKQMLSQVTQTIMPQAQQYYTNA